MNQKNTDLEKELADLKQKQGTTVMFSAYVDQFRTYTPGQVVVFNHEVTNIGQHYNTSTGVFTCPVSGYYVFDVHIMGQVDKNAEVVIRHNGANLAWAFADDKYDYQSGSLYVNIVLKTGDTVEVASYTTSFFNHGGGKFTTFSGHLINLL